MDTTASDPAHAHAARLDACLDLVNTLELTDGRPVEHLATADDAVAFLAERQLGHEADLRRQADRDGEAWLARIRAVRAALRETWDAQVVARRPSPDALATLNALLDRAPGVELRGAPDGIVVAHRHRHDDPAGEALARAVVPLVDAIAAGETHRFRICANDGCRWVFEDASRAGRRRWCDMATCGNRAKVRRFRSRRREDPAGEAGTAAGRGAETASEPDRRT